MTILFLCFFAYSNTVKVGYYIDSGNFMSGFSEEDPKSGYAYEYLQTISSYTGWDYEYVYGYFDDLYAKLLKGEIDILPDVSYCKTRENEILYPEYAMGMESYYLYANQKKNYIDINDLSKISNMKLALLKGSYQYNLCKNWLKKRGLTPEIHEFTYDTDIEKAKSVVLDIIKSNPKTLDSGTPGAADPFVALLTLGESTITLVTRTWVKSEDYWDVYFWINENLYSRLPENGIMFSYPQMTVNINKD